MTADAGPAPQRIRSPHDWPILFVGEANPYGVDPRYALYHEPERSAGGRLCRKICGLRPSTYLSIRRANLCPQDWSTREARRRAEMLVSDASAPWRTIVMLGVKVSRAFADVIGLPGGIVPWTTIDAGKFRLIALPHPSGLNRSVWNVPGAYLRARALLAEHAPGPPYGEADA